MSSRPSQRARWVVLLASIAVAAAIVGWGWEHRRAGTDFVEMDASTRALLERAGRSDMEPDPEYGTPGFPPPVARAPPDEATAKAFYPQIGDGIRIYDPALWMRVKSNFEIRRRLADHPQGRWVHRTNSLGMHGDSEPSPIQPDLRVLVTGASNVQGVGANDEIAVNRIEAMLAERRPGRRVEALNAGCGAYNFYNYIAVLERYRGLKPDVFVIVAYGGNDFFGGVKMWRYFRGLPMLTGHEYNLEGMRNHPDEFARKDLGTELAQVIHLLNNPEDFDTALCCACSITAEIDRICREDGIRFVVAYLPPPIVGQPEIMSRLRDDAIASLRIPPDSMDVSDRIADRWLGFARSRGVSTCDLRPAFRASKERLYYLTDTHMNVAGQRVLADTLFPVIDAAASGH